MIASNKKSTRANTQEKNLMLFESIKPAAYSFTEDQKGHKSLNPLASARSVMYDHKILRTCIDNNIFPEHLANAAKQLLEQINKQSKFSKDHPDPTKEDYIEKYKKHFDNFDINAIKLQVDLLDYILNNIDHLNHLLVELFGTNYGVFGVPTGQKAIEISKLFTENNKEKQKIKKILNRNRSNPTQKDEADTAAICAKHIKKNKDNTRMVVVQETKTDLIMVESDNNAMSDEDLLLYTMRVYGPEGLKHFYAILSLIYKSFDKNNVEWILDDHLERIGCKKSSRGSFKTEDKEMATKTMTCFIELKPVYQEKYNNNERRYEPLLAVYGITVYKGRFISKITVAPTDWYTESFTVTGDKSLQYSKITEKIATIPHEYNLALLLITEWLIDLRINGRIRRKIKTIMEKHDLQTNGKRRLEDLDKLEKQINFIKEEGYFKIINESDPSKTPFECDNPYEVILEISSPNWQLPEIAHIIESRTKPYLRRIPKRPLISMEVFKKALKQFPTQQQFAEHLGIERTLVTKILSGKRKISVDVSDKIRDLYLTEVNNVSSIIKS